MHQKLILLICALTLVLGGCMTDQPSDPTPDVHVETDTVAKDTPQTTPGQELPEGWYQEVHSNTVASLESNDDFVIGYTTRADQPDLFNNFTYVHQYDSNNGLMYAKFLRDIRSEDRDRYLLRERYFDDNELYEFKTRNRDFSDKKFEVSQSVMAEQNKNNTEHRISRGEDLSKECLGFTESALYDNNFEDSNSSYLRTRPIINISDGATQEIYYRLQPREKNNTNILRLSVSDGKVLKSCKRIEWNPSVQSNPVRSHRIYIQQQEVDLTLPNKTVESTSS